MMEPLLVTNDLNGNRLPSTVIPTVQDLTERAFTKGVDDLVTVRQMVTSHNQVVTSLVVIPMVIRRVLQGGMMLLAVSTNIIYGLILLDFLGLVFGEIPGLTTPQ